MPEAVLLLRLEGPLQSWGERARWDVRDSASTPTKSGVIGLLGAALGLRPGSPELMRLDAELHFGVRIDSPGIRLFDFHTVRGALPSADGGYKGTVDNPYTIISQRAYLQDASFLVGLEGARSLLERCRQALERPVWPYYLGRKSCPPGRPVLETLVEAPLSTALEESPRSSTFALPEEVDFLQVLVEDTAGHVRRRDKLTGRPSRDFEDNRYRRFTVPRPAEEEVTCAS